MGSGSSRRIDDYFKTRSRRASLRIGSEDSGLSELRAELERLNSRIDILEDLLKEILDSVRRVEKDVRGMRSLSSRSSVPAKLKEILSREGYLLASDARHRLGVSPARLVSIARESDDLVILELEGDMAIMSMESYRDFLGKLASTGTSDPEEAARALGRYSKLFLMLRRRGGVYYDSRSKSWKMLE